MAKKASQPPVEIEAAPPKTKKPRPRKKPPKAQQTDSPQEPPQLEVQPKAQPSTTVPPVKAKKKPPKPKIETESWFMFPSLHQKVVEAVSTSMPAPWFQVEDTDCYRINYYETNVTGSFRCTNRACTATGWSSKKVAIVIQGYSQNGYNAKVYNQRCERCDELGTFQMKKKDKQVYVERVAYRLKKWAGVEVVRPPFGSKKTDPHRRDLCEGCRIGVCPEREI